MIVRRLVIALLLAGVFALPAAAQEMPTTPEPTPDLTLARVEDAAARAERAAADASRYAADASNFLNIFEGIGLVVTIGAAVLGVIGFGQILTSRGALARARAEDQARLEAERKEDRTALNASLKDFERRFSRQIKRREEEIDQLGQDLAASAARQSAELDAARKGYEVEIARREESLRQLNDEIDRRSAAQQRRAANSTLALALLPLGERQYRAQDPDGALETYKRALELDADNPVIHYRIGYVHVQSGRAEEAEGWMTRALAIEPDFPLATAALGYIYRRIAEKMPEGVERNLKLNAAENRLLKALEVVPRLLDEDGESWWGSLGGLYRRRGQLDQAIAAYQQAGRVTPFSSYPFSNLALLYADKHDRTHMLEMYREVERKARDEAAAEVGNYWGYADLLTARLALGKTHEAEDALDSVLATAPSGDDYALDSLVGTLERLVEAMGGHERAPHVASFVGRIRAKMG